MTDYKGYSNRKNTKTGDAYGNREEQFVIQNYEHPAAAKHGMLQRTSHIKDVDGLRVIKTEGPLYSKPIINKNKTERCTSKKSLLNKKNGKLIIDSKDIKKIASFANHKFGNYAGIAQQYLFYYNIFLEKSQ